MLEAARMKLRKDITKYPVTYLKRFLTLSKNEFLLSDDLKADIKAVISELERRGITPDYYHSEIRRRGRAP